MESVGAAGSRAFKCPHCDQSRASVQQHPHCSAVPASPVDTLPTPAATPAPVVLDRDHNAAANILLMGARALLWGKRPSPWQRPKEAGSTEEDAVPAAAH